MHGNSWRSIFASTSVSLPVLWADVISASMAAPIGPYTPAYRAGDFLFCSGQIGLSGDDLVDGFDAQVKQALINLETLLRENDATMSDVVKATVFLTDIEHFAPMNDLYCAAFGDHRPARSTVVVVALPKGALFEVEAIAHVS